MLVDFQKIISPEPFLFTVFDFGLIYYIHVLLPHYLDVDQSLFAEVSSSRFYTFHILNFICNCPHSYAFCQRSTDFKSGIMKKRGFENQFVIMAGLCNHLFE